VLRPPHPLARLAAFEPRPVETLPGVVAVVVDGSFVGVVARREEEAEAALEKARRCASWQRTSDLPLPDDENAWMETVAPVSVAEVVRDDAADPAIVTRHAAAYSRPYIAHASLAPSCALAEWDDGRLTVWSHSQGVYPLRAQLAAALRAPADTVTVIHAMGAGCFGHNGADDVALDAALLARAARVPVMCRWSREDELCWAPCGAAMRIRLSAGLDSLGRIADWTHDVYSPPHVARPRGLGGGVNLLAAWHMAEPHAASPTIDARNPAGAGERNAVPLYRLGRRRIAHHLLPQGPLRTSALRSLGAHGNVFASESFMDELALLVGADPLVFRLAHLEDARRRAVIEAAASAARWDPAEKGGDGIGRGIGFARYKNMSSYCAAIARVELTDVVRLLSVHAAVDCGAVIHRDGVRNQIEGGVVQAASWTLKERIRWDADGIITAASLAIRSSACGNARKSRSRS
jgi:CO/xanthine dehydrogenase Mo-binding subunit